MKRALTFLASLHLSLVGLSAADLKPDTTTEIPASAKRDVVIKLDKSAIKNQKSKIPQADLPAGYELQVIAAPPLVTHPLMGCLDDRGRLFIGDAVGVNWNKKQLEANPPNRILMLEDTDGDGIYDKSTVFADKMTFPQGGCWLNGSLYVCSPPGIWKLTDTTGSGVADKREMIVSGFEYTGNAADVHGPWLHPNGRLYWCHGRKGHKVIGKEGTVVHEGLASGIWSCKPDGSDVHWHSLGCGDNPVKVDFTPEGEIIGVQNLYYSNPRGDTIVHWLYGGVYERSDQMKAIEGLPRMLEHMPVMYNFGHVAVSGCCFWHGSPFEKANPRALQFLVTHFNTQRVVRMELTPDGATYKATENEFLQLHDPDIHLTDVLEAADGSLLALNTGGWFRIGCPSSLMAKPDALGAVYRMKSKNHPVLANQDAAQSRPWAQDHDLNEKSALEKLGDKNPRGVLAALNWYAQHPANSAGIDAALVKMMHRECDGSTEHALLNALIAHRPPFMSEALAGPDGERAAARWLLVDMNRPGGSSELKEKTLGNALIKFDPAKSPVYSDAVRRAIEATPSGLDLAASLFTEWLGEPAVSTAKLSFVEHAISGHLAVPAVQTVETILLSHTSPGIKKTGLNVLARETSGATNESWFPPLEKMLAESPSPLLLDAIKKLKSPRFDEKLQTIASDSKQPLSLRLKAMDSMKGVKLTGDTFAMVKGILTDAGSSAAARIQAASMLATAPLQKEQITTLAPVLASVGPIELKALLTVINKCKEADLARTVAMEIAKNPVIASQQESVYRTALSAQPADIFETIVLPAYKKATEAGDAKKRLLSPLADKAMTQGDAKAGRSIYESGKGTCIACHQIGDKGRSIGPNLSKIGAIRTERDILESIMFPSNTIARDYEAHVIETGDGQSVMGVIKSHTAEGLLLVDAAGIEHNIPQSNMTADTQLTTSLMPVGLDQTLQEQELCDLVAFLRSLK